LDKEASEMKDRKTIIRVKEVEIIEVSIGSTG